MKYLFFVFALLSFGMHVQAQNKVGTYTITADSVLLTSCDSAELIIRNHTQNVPGFLFNAGNGRTIFQRGLQALGGSTYLIGADTLRAASSGGPSPFGDTLIKTYVGVVTPTGTIGQGTPITWKFATSNLNFSGFDSLVTVTTSAEIEAGFPSVQQVLYVNIGPDEMTYPLSPTAEGDPDGARFGVFLRSSGIGIDLVGTGSGWTTQKSQLYGYVLTLDTSTQGRFEFSLVDQSGDYLGATTDATVVQYTGSNRYSVERNWGPTNYNYSFILLDPSGNPVMGYPQTTDRMSIISTASIYQQVDGRYFSAFNTPYYKPGSKFWITAVVREYPDSLKISKPSGFGVSSTSSGIVNVGWNSVPNAASGYELRRASYPNFSNETVIYRGTNTSFTDTGLTSGTVYYYRLKAIRTVVGSNDVHSGFEGRSVTCM